MKRFTNEEKEAEKMFREYQQAPMKEEELLLMDTEIRKFNSISKRHDLFRWMVHRGAAKWIPGSQIKIVLGAYQSEWDRIRQWSMWRERKFPFDRRVAYERIASEKAAIGNVDSPARQPVSEPRKTLLRSKLNEYRQKFGADYQVPAGMIVIEDVAELPEHPADEINPEDIPF